MVQRCQHFSFALEAGEAFGIVCKRVRKDLESYFDASTVCLWPDTLSPIPPAPIWATTSYEPTRVPDASATRENWRDYTSVSDADGAERSKESSVALFLREDPLSPQSPFPLSPVSSVISAPQARPLSGQKFVPRGCRAFWPVNPERAQRIWWWCERLGAQPFVLDEILADLGGVPPRRPQLSRRVPARQGRRLDRKPARGQIPLRRDGTNLGSSPQIARAPLRSCFARSPRPPPREIALAEAGPRTTPLLRLVPRGLPPRRKRTDKDRLLSSTRHPATTATRSDELMGAMDGLADGAGRELNL